MNMLNLSCLGKRGAFYLQSNSRCFVVRSVSLDKRQANTRQWLFELTMRQCTKCGSIKSISEFRKQSNKGKDGLTSWCKTCLREKDKKRNNSDEFRQANKARCRTHEYRAKDKIREKERDDLKKKYKELRSMISLLIGAAAWVEWNKQRLIYLEANRKAYNKAYSDARKPKSKTCLRCNLEKPIEEFISLSKYCHACRKKNEHDRGVIKWQRRRQLISGCTIPVKQWRLVKAFYSPTGICPCCGQISKMTLDHVVPLALGGLHHISNVQPLCMLCNSKKQATIADYREDKGAYARGL